MDRKQELEVVTTAYFLEQNVDNLKNEKRRLEEQKPTKPNEPQRGVITQSTTRPYPPINASHIKIPNKWKISMCVCPGVVILLTIILMQFSRYGSTFLVSLIGLLWPAGLVFVIFAWYRGSKEKGKLRNEYIEQVKKSSEYQEACKKVDEENQKMTDMVHGSIEKIYQTELENYKLSLQKYNENLPLWNEEYTSIQSALTDTEKTLREMYQKTSIVPADYRNLYAVSYLAAFLGTTQNTDYDLRYAIERYDDKIKQLLLKENNDINRAIHEGLKEINGNLQYSNYLSEQMNYLAEEGNETLKNISDWQKADIMIREYRRIKAKRNSKK